MDLQIITLQMNQLCFTKNSTEFAKSPGEVSYASPGNSVEFPIFLLLWPRTAATCNNPMENQSFVVGSNSSMWSLSPATCNKLEPILCIEEPMSSLPDSTVSLLRLSLMNATDVLLDIHDRLCIHVHTGRANLSANVGVGTWIRFDGYWVQEALCSWI